MKAKNRILGIVLFVILFSLLACNHLDEEGEPLGSGGDQEIKESGDGDYNLEILTNEADSYTISFQGPEDAVELRIRVYRLGAGGWETMTSQSIIRTAGDDHLSGVFDMETNDDYGLEFTLENSDEEIFYSTEKILLDREIIEKDKIFLAQSREASLNKETPLGLIIYSSKLGIGGFSLDDFYDFEKLQDLDLVQAVTFEFLNK